MRKGTLRYPRTVAFAAMATALACRSKEPRLSVFSPPASSHFTKGDTIHFASELNSEMDPGPIKSDAWQWVSNRDGEIGRGPRVDVATLAVGEHKIIASVKHRLGVSRDSLTVFVDPPK